MGLFSEQMKETMKWLGEMPDTVFVGQAVKYPGTFMSHTLELVPDNSKIEFPVCESLQMQFTLGLSIGRVIPISIFPRQNFLLLATADLLTLNNWEEMTGERPHVIIRTAIGVSKPNYPGIQHVGDYAEHIQAICPNIKLVKIDKTDDIFNAYKHAYLNSAVWLMVEDGNKYSE